MRFPLVKVQLLLLAAVAALTLGAVSLAGTVPTASISAAPSSAAGPSTEAVQGSAGAAAAVSAPATTGKVTAAQSVAVEPAAEPTAPPQESGPPAGCTAAIQIFNVARGNRGIPLTASIATAFADCGIPLPAGIEQQDQKKATEGDSGD